jgi:N-acetylglutamate synthase-like GNAT family acetyltransferase
MKIFVRQISREDAPTIASLCHQLGYELSTEQTLENINIFLTSEAHNAFVAEYDKKVIGWIGASQLFQLQSAPCCEIRGLVVDEKHRNKGVGKMLIEKVRQWGREKGNDKLRLRCNLKRTETHLFYQHLGFKEIKEQKVFEIKI